MNEINPNNHYPPFNFTSNCFVEKTKLFNTQKKITLMKCLYFDFISLRIVD